MCFGPELAAAAGLAAEGSAGIGAAAVPAAASSISPYLLAGSLASTAAGTYAANRQARAQQESLNRFSQADQEHQSALQTEANKKIKDTVGQFTPEQQQQQLAAAEATRSAAMQPAVAPQASTYAPGTVAAPTEVKDDAKRRIGDVMLAGQLAASRKAKLGAFGDTSLTQNLALNRTGEDVGRLQNFSAGDTRLLPYELQSAALKGRNWAGASDIANTIGSIGTLYGMTRKKPAGGIGYGAASNPYALGQADGPY